MLYRITQTDNVFDINPELESIPEFAKLDDPAVNARTPEARDRRIKFVILYADKKSPLRTLPEDRRREEAARIAGYPMEGKRLDRNGRDICAGKYEAVESAIKRYRELQYDDDADTLEVKKALLQKNKDYIKAINKNPEIDGKELTTANKIAKELPELVESLKRLEATLSIVEVKLEIPTYTAHDLPQGEQDQELSTLDQVMMGRQKQ